MREWTLEDLEWMHWCIGIALEQVRGRTDDSFKKVLNVRGLLSIEILERLKTQWAEDSRKLKPKPELVQDDCHKLTAVD